MIRQMLREDLEKCEAIVRETMGDELADAFMRNVGCEEFNGEPYRIVACDKYNQTNVLGLGGVVSDEMSLETCWVAWFAVMQGAQGSGIGQMLIRCSLDNARARGYKRIYVETYDRPEFRKARVFYDKMGFKPMGWLEAHHPSGDGNTVYMGMEL